MRLIRNLYQDTQGHEDVLIDRIKTAQDIKLLVAYVNSGVVSKLRPVADILKKKTKKQLICNLDMGITDPGALQEFIRWGFEIKRYEMSRGTFHPKVWLFLSEGGSSCIIGSANATGAALSNNIEVGVLIGREENESFWEQTVGYFDYLCKEPNSQFLSLPVLKELADQKERAKRWKSQRRREALSQTEDSVEDKELSLAKDFVEGWINLWNKEIASGLVHSRHPAIGRGWYIIPDQGYINDETMLLLQKITRIMEGGLLMPSGSPNPKLRKILDLISSKFVGKKQKMDSRSKFVRQEKNYLIRLGFCYHPLTQTGTKNAAELLLTDYGRQLSEAKNIAEIKSVYTDAMTEYRYQGLPLLEFIRVLLTKLEYVTFDEFNFFVKHAWSADDLDRVCEIIRVFRHASAEQKKNFVERTNRLLREKVERSGASVVSNYKKSAGHTLSALGWCEGLDFDFDDERLCLRPGAGQAALR